MGVAACLGQQSSLRRTAENRAPPSCWWASQEPLPDQRSHLFSAGLPDLPRSPWMNEADWPSAKA